MLTLYDLTKIDINVTDDVHSYLIGLFPIKNDLNLKDTIYNLLKNKGLELNDVIQEATIGFEEAIMGYNQDDNALFYTFANCIKTNKCWNCYEYYK